LEWDGVNTLTLDTSGVSGITALHIAGVNRLREIEEVLTPDSDFQTFYASYGSWRPGWLVLVDGVPENLVSVSSNIVSLSRVVSGEVRATYAIEQYTTSGDTSGNIRVLFAGTGLSSGTYKLLLSRRVRGYPVDLADVQRALLLTVDGLPNALMLDLARQLSEGNPTAFATARWGSSANWFERLEEQPRLSRLPLSFDTADL
jgi:hypothetical protein